jgi:hypothetical protein
MLCDCNSWKRRVENGEIDSIKSAKDSGYERVAIISDQEYNILLPIKDKSVFVPSLPNTLCGLIDRVVDSYMKMGTCG